MRVSADWLEQQVAELLIPLAFVMMMDRNRAKIYCANVRCIMIIELSSGNIANTG